MTEERRLVTVLFADVTGSTALGESLDPLTGDRPIAERGIAVLEDLGDVDQLGRIAR